MNAVSYPGRPPPDIALNSESLSGHMGEKGMCMSRLESPHSVA